MKRSLFFCTAFFYLSCKTNEPSQTKFSITQPKEQLDTLTGRLELIKQNKSSRNRILICTSGGHHSYTSAQLLFETKLATAMWMDASRYFNADDWKLLSFIENQNCAQQDDVDMYIHFVDDGQSFTDKKITFTRQGQTIDQKYNKTTWGSISFDFTPDVDGVDQIKFEKIEFKLNKTIDWVSLGQHFQRDSSITNKPILLETYNKLSTSTVITYQQLIDFGKLINSNQLKKYEIRDIEKYLTEFKASNIDTKEYILKPFDSSSFDIILHEVGHAFGLEHAHEKDDDMITGNELGQIVSEPGDNRTPHTTDQAVMAYNKIAHLTVDDLAGMKELAKRTVEYVKTIVLNSQATANNASTNTNPVNIVSGNGILGSSCNENAQPSGCAQGYTCLRLMQRPATCYKRCDGNVGGFCSFGPDGLERCRAEPMQSIGVDNAGVCIQVCGGSPPPCASGWCKPCPGSMVCEPSPIMPGTNICR